MGQKVHPKGIRLGYIKDWDSKWFNMREMPDFIEEIDLSYQALSQR